MKKISLDPLSLDKETFALLDEKQLKAIVGGLQEELIADTTGCIGGHSTCSGKTVGCAGGYSTCY